MEAACRLPWYKKLLNPREMGILRAQAIVLEPNLVTNLIKKFLWLRFCRTCMLCRAHSYSELYKQ